MPTQTQITSDLVGLAGILKTLQLRVPRYQRSYTWKRENVDTLLDDIITAMDAGDGDYFLGSIVLERTNDSAYEIIDGQQRLATALIVLAAIRDKLHADGQVDSAQELSRDYIATRDRRTLSLTPKLSLNDSDQSFFFDLIISFGEDKPAPVPSRDSHKALLAAYECAKERITGLASSGPARLHDLADYLTDNAVVIRVVVPDDINAFRIFEALNDRGIDLAISDLLKNYLFSISASRIDETQAAWLAMTSILESTGEKGIVLDYIRHAWSARNGLVRERQLFADVKKKSKNPAQAVELSNQLRDDAKKYTALLGSPNPLWHDYGSGVKGAIAALNILRIEQVRPLTLAICTHFSIAEAKKAIPLVTNGVVRVVIAGARGGTFEKLYADLAKRITSGEIKTSRALLTQMTTKFPNDLALRDAFTSFAVSKAPIARYLLRTIELATCASGDWIPNENEQDVNLEHIMPLNLSAEWDVDGETHLGYRSRLGNLAIMASKDNGKIGSKKFAEKKKIFAQSSFETTRMISKYKTWDQRSIEDRQSKLAEIAPKAWPLGPK